MESYKNVHIVGFFEVFEEFYEKILKIEKSVFGVHKNMVLQSMCVESTVQKKKNGIEVVIHRQWRNWDRDTLILFESLQIGILLFILLFSF